MKTNRPAHWLTGLLLVSLFWIASPVMAQTAPPGAPARAAATLIANVEMECHATSTDVSVLGDGRLTYQVLKLHDPDRVVLDFPGVRLAVEKNSLAGGTGTVRKVRLSQFKADVARVVIDLEAAVPYTVRPQGNRVTIAFTGLAAAPQAPAVPNRPTQKAAIDLLGLPLPASLLQPAAGLARYARSPEPPQQAPAPVQNTPAPNPPAQNTTASNSGASSAVPAPRAPTQQNKYTGEPISVNLKDVDLKDFFRLIHEISGLNVVLDPSVKGTLPALVLDEVPWDQALEIVLRNNDLDKQLEGNVLRIATKETVKREAELRRDLAKAEAEAVEPVTTTRVLSYAKAAGMRETLHKFLSSRGEILSDDRSNTLIIRDIPSVLPEIDNLIRQLDRKSQQVEIEARVVAASRSFAQDIGTQFGFASFAVNGRNVFGGLTGPAGFVSPIAGPSSLPPPLVVSGTNSLPLNVNLGAGTPTSGISFSHRSPNFALDFILSAAESKGVGKLLSKPRIVTQNNEKGTVKQGTKIPVQTIINNTISVQFVDAVLKLEVTPMITAEGTIYMEVVIENTQIDQGIPRVQGIPALDTQSVDSRVLINDGGTVVIGGIIISSQRTQVNQVPLFGSIPLLGHLFKRTQINVDSQELLFFLTPRIVTSS